MTGNVVAVVRTLNGDFHPPVDVFASLGNGAPYSFLFESVEGGDSLARYSFIGIEPEMIVRGQSNQTIVERQQASEVLEISVSDFLTDYFRDKTLADADSLPPLAGGAVGYLGFRATSWFEPAFSNHQNDGSNDAVFLFFSTIVAIDRSSKRTQIVSLVFTEEAAGDRVLLQKLYEQAAAKTAQVESAMLARPASSADALAVGEEESEAAPFISEWKRESFEAAVMKVKEHIAAGDCYQVVLSQCFKRKTRATPLGIYRALRATNPSPYMFILRLGAETILGASPEMLVRCRGKDLQYRPIAGTRPRGRNANEDARLGEELRADEKEVAEHVMLVDLGRNDLGRVAEYGSVRVDQLMALERYSHVQHLVTNLSAQLRYDCDRFTALAACFPAGTVTGAPKVRAMEIIQQLEPTARGVYSGAVLYADYAGNLDSCIAIRTLVLNGQGVASVQAGAGIVADSVPACEYEETLNKACALFRAVEIAEGGCKANTGAVQREGERNDASQRLL